MIKIKCSSEHTATLIEMTPFQGELKKRSDNDINDLIESLTNDGLLMPFAIWQTPEEEMYILDGHGRMQALVKMALSDATILQQEFPILLIQAENEDDARKILLQITSTYGKFNNKAVVQFASTILDYKAPVLVKTRKKLNKPAKTIVNDDKVLVRVRVPRDKVSQLTALLKQVSEIEVL